MDVETISSSMDENGMGISELAVTRVVAGTPEELRPRLAEALERLGFYIVDEQRSWPNAASAAGELLAVRPTS